MSPGVPVLNARAQAAIDVAKVFAKHNFGAAGFREDEAVDRDVRWRPTFLIRPNRALLIAFEFSEILFPDILAVAMTDLVDYGTPTKVYQVTTLAVYQADRNQSGFRRLRDRGIGLITVDEETRVASFQSKAIPVAQNISEREAIEAFKPIPTTWRVPFRSALDSYLTNETQGLQAASQLVEAIIRAYHDAALKKGWVKARTAKDAAALLVDDLYQSPQCTAARNLFGGLRAYLDTYRNIASHPVKTPEAATARIRKCRAGFIEACRLAGLASSRAKSSSPPLILRIHTAP